MSDATTTSSKMAEVAKPTRGITICVYCGSSTGNDPAHLQTARDLARLMAARGAKLGKFTNIESKPDLVKNL